MRKAIWDILLTLVVCLAVVAPASAEVVTVSVEGVVNKVVTSDNFGLDGSVSIGSSMSGQCTYDTDAPNLGDNLNGIYTPISISMTIGNYTFAADSPSADSAFFIVYTVDPGYRVYSTTSSFVGTIYEDASPRTFNDITWTWTDLELMDFLAGSGYSHTHELPDADSFPDISVFDLRKDFEVYFVDELWPSDSMGYFGIEGEVTSLTVIPEPVTTYYVDALNGDDDNDGLSLETAFATIQKGIDSANDGDTVIVAPGTYTGPGNRDIDFGGLAITVRSIDPNDPNIVAATIIDCNGTGANLHRGFYFHNNEDANSVVAGLTIIKGYDVQGGGIYCSFSSPTISNCTISSNMAGEGGGGGIRCRFSSSPIISNCTITNNMTEGGWGGGGICSSGWSSNNPIITNCNITGNLANNGGGICCWHGSPIITNCTISGNSATGGNWGSDGGGIYFGDCTPTVTNCTISGNSAKYGGGGIYCSFSSPTISNCIIWGNYGASAINSSGLDVTYSDIEGGWAGVGNIDDDPMFVSPGYWADANDHNIIVEPNNPNAVWVDGDYHLLATSPCIDAASDANIHTDIEGNIRPFDFPGIDNNAELPEFDMGAYEATVQTEGKLLILPEAIRRYGRAKKILAILRLPKGVTKDQIDSNEPLFLYPEGDPNGIEAVSQYVLPSGRRRAKRTIIFAFFDKAELMEAVPDGRVQLHVVGMFDTRRYFHGTDSVWIKGRQRRGRGRRR